MAYVGLLYVGAVLIWLYWSFLWLLFFLLLRLKIEKLTRYTGWVAAIEGWVTGAIPAFLILTGYWRNPNAIAIALLVFGVAVFVALGWGTTPEWSLRGFGLGYPATPTSR